MADAARRSQQAHEYRLADLLTRTEWQNKWVRNRPYVDATGKFDGLANYIVEHFPTSIGAEFIRLMDTQQEGAEACAARPNFSQQKLDCTADIVARMIARRATLKLPAPDTLVVHLRLGDVIDAPTQYPPNRSKAVHWPANTGDPARNWHRAPDFSARSWLDGEGVANAMFGGAMRYVRPQSFYQRLRLPANVTRAVVLGNTQFMMGGAPGRAPLPAPFSHEYARGIVEVLEGRGLRAHLNLDGEADEDFAFMASADHFVRSGGGFSTLISRIVQRRGGRVYPSLGESDWLEPRQVEVAKRRGSLSFYPSSVSRRLEERAKSPAGGNRTSRCDVIAAKPLAYAGVRADSPLLLQDGPPFGDSPTCSLGFLSDRLYLLTFLSGLEHLLAGHFVRHYVSAVGVPPQHVRAFVHQGNVSGAETQLTARRFTDAGVPSAFVRLLTGVFTEARRFEAINGEIMALPADAWVIHADVDEFFSYPCGIEQQIGQRQGHEIFCAEMRDALAFDGMVGELPPLVSSFSLQPHDLKAAYPHSCYVRQHYWRNDARTSAPPLSKVVLMKAASGAGTRRSFVDSHHLAGYRRMGFRCRAIGYFDHYTLTAQALRALHKVKLARGHQYQRDSGARSLYTAIAQFLTDHQQKDARGHAWCKPPPQPADDNVTIHRNSILDICGKPVTRLGAERAV